MKAYLITSGILFVLAGIGHVWELIERGHFDVSDAIVLPLTAGLAVWAWRLLRKPAAP